MRATFVQIFAAKIEDNSMRIFALMKIDAAEMSPWEKGLTTGENDDDTLGDWMRSLYRQKKTDQTVSLFLSYMSSADYSAATTFTLMFAKTPL